MRVIILPGAFNEREDMCMAECSIRYYTNRERMAYQKINGLNQVLCAAPTECEEVETKYPDAVFAVMIHDEMVCGVAGVHDIVQRAHTAILDGEKIGNVRIRYFKEMDRYFADHSWDD